MVAGWYIAFISPKKESTVIYWSQGARKVDGVLLKIDENLWQALSNDAIRGEFMQSDENQRKAKKMRRITVILGCF